MRWLLLSLALAGCARPVEAPQEMEALSTFLFEAWDDEGTGAMASAVDNLYAWAEGVDLDGDVGGRSYVLGGFDRAEVEGVVNHDNDPLDTVGVGVLFPSTHAIADHLVIIGYVDQTPVEPSSPDLYTREFIAGDPDCMRAGGCGVMRAINDVERRNFLYTLRYDLLKEWRWVALEGRAPALAARSFNLDETDNGGDIRLLQGYSIDLYLPTEGGSLRYQVTWQQTELPGLTDSDMTRALADGVDDVLSHQDDFLSDSRE